MFVSRTHKFIFSRSAGCADAAVELAFRRFFGDELAVATSMPFYKMQALGPAEELGLNPFDTVAELKEKIPDGFKFVVVNREPLAAIYSQFKWQSAIGKFNKSFRDFVRARLFKLNVGQKDNADVVLEFDTLSQDFKKFAASYGVKVPSDFKIDENDLYHFVDKFDVADVYDEGLLAFLGLSLPVKKQEPVVSEPEVVKEPESVAEAVPQEDSNTKEEPFAEPAAENTADAPTRTYKKKNRPVE
jgi:hypothetical protein